MTPKEKAQDLVDRMFGIQVDNQTFHMYNTLETAKYSALIAVDELIEYSAEWGNVDYWEQVKTEIENL